MQGDFNKNPTNGWVPFWFEANSWFGWVNSLEMFEDLKSVYPDCLEAKSSDWAGGPKFGYRMECNGQDTLGDFLKRNDQCFAG